jgi:FMN phosphatase YigB (HAD superfamily)
MTLTSTPTEQVLHVGDSAARDAEGALAVGSHSVRPRLVQYYR